MSLHHFDRVVAIAEADIPFYWKIPNLAFSYEAEIEVEDVPRRRGFDHTESREFELVTDEQDFALQLECCLKENNIKMDNMLFVVLVQYLWAAEVTYFISDGFSCVLIEQLAADYDSAMGDLHDARHGL